MLFWPRERPCKAARPRRTAGRPAEGTEGAVAPSVLDRTARRSSRRRRVRREPPTRGPRPAQPGGGGRRAPKLVPSPSCPQRGAVCSCFIVLFSCFKGRKTAWECGFQRLIDYRFRLYRLQIPAMATTDSGLSTTDSGCYPQEIDYCSRTAVVVVLCQSTTDSG